jgi:hypothetical protein
MEEIFEVRNSECLSFFRADELPRYKFGLIRVQKSIWIRVSLNQPTNMYSSVDMQRFSL